LKKEERNIASKHVKEQQLAVVQTIFYVFIFSDGCPNFGANFRSLANFSRK
jgi:hypothetical protein